ncbi:MAG: hypothetical protein AB8F74_03305 [Saprospiraceae bacterium]
MKPLYIPFKFFCFILLFMAITPCVDGQVFKTPEDKIASKDHIYDLQSGVLIVRLPSKNNKITAFQEMMNRSEMSKAKRKNLKERLEETINERDKKNVAIMNAFKEYYTFSNYRFVYDTAVVHLFRGDSRGHFLNDDLQVDSTITVFMGDPIYTLKYGQTSSSEANSLEGFIITDNSNVELKKPFPYFIKTAYPPASFFRAFFGKATTPSYDKMAYRLNKKLNKRLELIKGPLETDE